MRLFFPEHDLALANGVKHFNPPRMALDLAAYGEELAPYWQQAGEGPLPWGWDWDSRAELKRAGIPSSELPTDDELQEIRRLSSREQTLSILLALRNLCPGIVLPERLDSPEGLDTYLVRHESDTYVLKSPWSSSGRGLSLHPQQDSGALRRRGLHVIRQMGCIIAEPWYDKVQDFAMLFFVNRLRQVCFKGYSLFENDSRGTYLHGMLASNGEIEATLCRQLNGTERPREQLHEIRQTLKDWIGRAAAPFRSDFPLGWVGIDMMIVDKDGTRILHPCVEMNLRSTMGVVARNMYDWDGKTGIFTFKKTK